MLWPPDMKSLLTGKDPDARKDWGQEERGQQRIRWLDSITDSKHMTLSKLREIVKDKEALHAAVHGDVKSQTQQSNWTPPFWLVWVIHHGSFDFICHCSFYFHSFSNE